MNDKKIFGISVYLENFNKEYILKFPEGTFVFVSAHMPEDILKDNFKEKIDEIFNFLIENKYKIISDISPQALKKLKFESPAQMSKEFKIDYIRLDFGFEDKISELNKTTNIIINASTIREIDFPDNATFMHNFYPRKDTGLSRDNFEKMNSEIKLKNGKVFTFIPGNKLLRGPVYEQLPTLEEHRNKNIFYTFLDMYRNENIDGVFVADCEIDDETIQNINTFISEGVINIKADMPEIYIGKNYQLRSDSGENLERLNNSRWANIGEMDDIEPSNTIARPKGSITIDNKLYKRYMGEIAFVKNDLEADERVNVLATMDKELIDILKPLDNIKFIK